MSRYLVQWEIDSDAESPIEAAREAWAAMRRHDSIANYFTVKDTRTGEAIGVDLLEENAKLQEARQRSAAEGEAS